MIYHFRQDESHSTFSDIPNVQGHFLEQQAPEEQELPFRSKYGYNAGLEFRDAGSPTEWLERLAFFIVAKESEL
jgi:hypothetical protein